MPAEQKPKGEEMAADLVDLAKRVEALEQSNRAIAASIILPDDNTINVAVMRLEEFANNLNKDPLMKKSEAEVRMKAAMDAMASMVSNRAQSNQIDNFGWKKAILESKGIQDLISIADAKQHRAWNKMKNAMDDVSLKSREKHEIIERLTEAEINEEQSVSKLATKREAIIRIIEEKPENKSIDETTIKEELEALNRDMWSIRVAKTIGEAEGNMDAC